MSSNSSPHTETVIIHHLHWDGPFDSETAKNHKWSEHPGIYQIYGSHATEGSDTLLYIGLNGEVIGDRVSAHEGWLRKEYDDAKFYLGRLVDENKVKDALKKGFSMGDEEYHFLDETEGVDQGALKRVESLLIFYCSPPYNSRNIQGPSIDTDQIEGASAIVLYNTGFMGKIPVELSTLWYDRWLHKNF